MTDHTTVLLFTVLFPVLCALALFLLLRKATTKRKFLTYFVGLPFFVVPILLLLTDFPGIIAGIADASQIGTIPSAVELSLAAALGIVYLGVSAVICAERIMKTGGILFISAATLVSFVLEIVLGYFTLFTPAGEENAPTFGSVFPSLQNSAFAGTSVRFLLLFLLCLFLVCFFLSFLWIRRASDLQTEDIIRLHREEEKERLIEKEGVCAVCRFACPIKDNPRKILCDKKGEQDIDARCPHFEYDPLKRVPERK